MAEQNFQHIIPSLQNCISERNIMQSKLLLEELYPADIAELLQEFTVTEQKFLLDCIDNDISSSVLLELDEDERGKLIESFSAKEIAEEMIQEMDSDDAADIISELSEGKKEEVFIWRQKRSSTMLQNIPTLNKFFWNFMWNKTNSA
ncbi:hypothetical protein H9Q08_05580 [Chryseobacterium sp. PS-8]|uniref:Magnesium transporter MgtE intracellular domain-containing protein n=1 Tax=Chryseobacterium indicum TaxID=2766954 RepID=A0ABS9C3F0_9FLAO|nr:hypothetical protein [Chryseobacterium sp. PS-8]MCF2218768.1 hypothetical protein [Chryseobacterium sp. PS-8]